MKVKLLSWLGLFCSCFSGVVMSEVKPQDAYLLPHAEKSILTDLVQTPSGNYVAAGERGHILVSTDGAKWQQSPVPMQSSLNSVFFVDAEHGWAVGHDASIIATTDGGKTWQLQQYLPELDKPLFDVFFSDNKHGFAIGAYGLFYRTVDGGQHWQQEWHAEFANTEDAQMLAELKDSDPEGYQLELASVLPHLNRLVIKDNTIYLVGEAGFWAISRDNGATWQRQPAFYNGSLFAIERTTQGTLIAAGLRGHAFRSADQGLSWQPIPLSSPATLNSIQTSGNSVWLFGNSGVIFQSQDDGQTFQLIPQKEGKAVLNGLPLEQKLLLVTETGIKTIENRVSPPL